MGFKIGWFSTGRDEQASVLLEDTCKAIEERRVENLAISFVFCNRERGEGKESDEFIDLVNRKGIPLILLSSKKFRPDLRKKALKEKNESLLENWRILYDREIMKRIKRYPFRIIFLAGYMLILGPEFCRNYPVFNLHPAAPGGPRGTWQEVIWQLIEKKAKNTGLMIHRVTPELDSGPAITFCLFSIRGKRFDPLWDSFEKKLKKQGIEAIKAKEGENEPLFAAIREEQKKREFPLIISTLNLLSQGEINPGKITSPRRIEL